MTDDLQRLLASGFAMIQDYYDFLDCYFLQSDDEPGALDHEENDQLSLFFTMYSSLSDESAGFGELLGSLCNKDDTYNACTDEEDQLDLRDEIKRDVLSHLTTGLERCGRDRSEILHGVNFGIVDAELSECYSLIDDIDEGTDPDELDIESRLDEIRSPFDELVSLLASSSWFAEWEDNKYTIDVFSECLRMLRAVQERELGAMRKRVEREGTDLKANYDQKVAGHRSGVREVAKGSDN